MKVDRDEIWTRGRSPCRGASEPVRAGHTSTGGHGPAAETEAPPLAAGALFDRRAPARHPYLACADRAFVASARAAGRSALLMLSDDGRPIARRGAIKEAPVEVAKLNPLTAAAFVSIEDRRFYRHWGIDPRGSAARWWPTCVAEASGRAGRPSRSSSRRRASCRTSGQ